MMASAPLCSLMAEILALLLRSGVGTGTLHVSPLSLDSER